MDFADFDEDLFDSKPRRKQNDLSETIRNYKAKQVYSRKFFQETPTNTEDLANSFKMKGHLEYYSQNFASALSFFENSLETSRTSESLNETIFQRELTENIARCLVKLNRVEEAETIAFQMEQASTNFEQYTTSLNLHLNILDHAKKIGKKLPDDHLLGVVLTKLVLMHPMSTHFWQKLADHLAERVERGEVLGEELWTTFAMVKEMAKFGSSSKNDIYLRYRLDMNSWIQDRESVIYSLVGGRNSQASQVPLNERLEKLDKWEDNVKLREALNLTDLRHFFTLF